MNPLTMINRACSSAGDQLLSRRDALLDTGKLGAGIALAALPFGLGASARAAWAQPASTSVLGVLNFALTLEYLEARFYIMGVASGIIPAADLTVFTTIRDHEIVHRDYLIAAIQSLGGTPVPEPTFDFTAGGAFPTVFTSYPTFLVLAQGFEDTGVRAYKGQLGNLQSSDAVLTAAATIHSVEARHAAEVRRLRGLEGWVPFNGNDSPAALAAVYAGEANTVHAGVQVAGLSAGVALEEVTEAFDEPLTMAQVLAIAGPFIVA